MIFIMGGQYHKYIVFVITYVVLADDVIAQMVPAGHTIFPMIGQYRIYVMDVIAQTVPAQ